jgi:hypothetical protein
MRLKMIEGVSPANEEGMEQQVESPRKLKEEPMNGVPHFAPSEAIHASSVVQPPPAAPVSQPESMVSFIPGIPYSAKSVPLSSLHKNSSCACKEDCNSYCWSRITLSPYNYAIHCRIESRVSSRQCHTRHYHMPLSCPC